MATVWLIFATLAVAPFLAGPLLVYCKWITSATRDIVGIHTDQQHLPAQLDAFTQQTLRALYPSGFQFAAAAIILDGAPNQRFVSLLENPRTRDVAVLTLCAKGRRKQNEISWSTKTKSVEFISEFSDGRQISTESPGHIHSTAGHNSKHLELPGYKDAAAMYDVHRAFVNCAAPRRRKCRVTEGRPLDYIRALEVKDLYRGIERRDLFLDSDTGRVHPTIKGAIRIGLAKFTPLFWIRMLLHHQIAIHLVARFGDTVTRRPSLQLRTASI